MSRITTVIAEDDFRVADIHEKFLKKFEEIEVVGKSLNGDQTLRILQEKTPDLLILDVYMPDMLGSDLLPIIRERFPKVSIIMITAATDKFFIEKALGYGVENYLIKPVNRERFDEVIIHYMKKYSLLTSKHEIDQDYVAILFGNKKIEKAGKDATPTKCISGNS